MKTQTLEERKSARNIILGAVAVLYAVSFMLPPREEEAPPPPPRTPEWRAAGSILKDIDYSEEVLPYREPLEEWEEK